MTAVIRRRTPYYPAFKTFQMQNRRDHRKNYVPLNIIENDHVYKVELNVAGWAKEDIEIRIEDNTLSIRGKRERVETEEKRHFHVREFSGNRFFRSLILSDKIDQESIKAELNDGILRIELTKVESGEAELSRKIEIS